MNHHDTLSKAEIFRRYCEFSNAEDEAIDEGDDELAEEMGKRRRKYLEAMRKANEEGRQ